MKAPMNATRTERKQQARRMLAAKGLDLRADFHVYQSAKVELIEAVADALKYRKPANAPGSRCRMFWQWATSGKNEPTYVPLCVIPLAVLVYLQDGLKSRKFNVTYVKAVLLRDHNADLSAFNGATSPIAVREVLQDAIRHNRAEV